MQLTVVEWTDFTQGENLKSSYWLDVVDRLGHGMHGQLAIRSGENGPALMPTAAVVARAGGSVT